MIYIVRQSGTAGDLFLSCPLGLPGAYNVHCGAQWDCQGLMSELPSGTTGGL